VSNSNDQIQFIQERSKVMGYSHIHASVQDVNTLNLPTEFDRVISIEMFEHIRNYKLLLEKIKLILKPDGFLFVHIFCHKTATYFYEEKGEKDWMTRNFFRGGIMPSENIFSYFDEFRIKKTWTINGVQYTRTLNEWLRIHDESKANILKIFKKHYDRPLIHFHRWRLFYIACSEFFNINNGKEWYVSHYLLSPKNNSKNSGL
tara:strand:- start:59 stop:667 length:609 start_codon:yes stop_codon:yes gene_type:complete